MYNTKCIVHFVLYKKDIIFAPESEGMRRQMQGF